MVCLVPSVFFKRQTPSLPGVCPLPMAGQGTIKVGGGQRAAWGVESIKADLRGFLWRQSHCARRRILLPGDLGSA